MIKALGPTLELLRPKLRQYLQKRGTQFKGRMFQCPNRVAHKNQDIKPACNFVDAEEHKFYCFVCGSTGDIFDAVNLLEGRPITGGGFHDTVEYLCTLLKIPYQAVEDSPESTFLVDVEKFITGMVKKAHDNLLELRKTDPAHTAITFLTSKGWLDSVEKFNLGILHKVETPKSQKLIEICNFLNIDINNIDQVLTSGIIIPIYFHHHIVGFQIRSLSPTAEQKYKTFLATTKGLYNLDPIDPQQPVYVVEGASSVIVLHTMGITNVIATLGNAFNQANYEAIVAKGIKDLVVIYDNDEGGNLGREKICEQVVGKRDLHVTFKILETEKDPADYVLANKRIEDLKSVSLWDFLKSIKKQPLLLKFVASRSDLIEKEKMVGELTDLMDVTKTALVEEIQKYEEQLPDVPTITSLKERESLIETINTFEKWAWSRGALLGVKSFPSFDTNFDGLQEGLILVGGAPNQGKSALVTSVALSIIDQNPTAYVVYLSIDDSAIITTARFLANLSGIPINIVSNPKNKIVDNPYYTKDEKENLMVKREKALDYLKKNVSTFNLKDACAGYTIEYIQTLFKSLEPIIKGRQVVLCVDNLHKLKSIKEFKSDKSLVDMVCGHLKILSSIYKCPVIATVEHTKQAIQLGEHGGSAIKETSSLHYDANLIMTVATKQVVGTFKLIDVIVGKNKMSTFIGTLPFKFYPELSKMEESSQSEKIFGKQEEEPAPTGDLVETPTPMPSDGKPCE